ncbi:BppU family phage baseplate upper protein [Clostridium perfringens]|uniref:BppU family phage baseplate upper protein n=1 Tax=Clostridium perfringens TaxID=1502 RepID=UPI0024441EB1|nr:BppU family phage baseplate upper protein [Clostridium perfringens]MDG6877294.1 hypothetical protein [Clostridium perfringens]
MNEIGLNINVDFYNNEGIKTIKGNNNAEIYKLYILKNKRRLSLVGKTVKLGYVMAGTTKGDIIENLNITNAEQGEITFPITNRISKQDGVYSCQLAIYGADGFLEHTATFGLTVEANIFTKIAGEIENSKDLTYIERILEEAKTVSGELKTNIPVATNLNSSLESNISSASNINTTLADTTEKSKVAATDVIEKKSQLEKSITKAKEFIDGLDGSQNIPQLRLDVTELQNGLKSNQALSYEGSSISADNTLEGRTEGMLVKGRTLQNLLGRTYSDYYSLITDIKPNTIYTVIKFNNRNRRVGIFKDNPSITPIEEYTGRMIFSFNSGAMDDYKSLRFYQDANMGGIIEDDKNIIILEGDYTKTNNYIPNYFEGIKSFGEQEGNKISILSHGKNLFNVNNSKQGLLNVNTGILFETNTSNTSDYIKVEKGKNYIINGEGGEIRGYYGVLYDCSKRYVAQKTFSKNTPFTFEQDGYFRFSYASEEDGLPATNIIFEEGTQVSAYEPYKEDKKDILIKEPLREGDYLYEDNGQIKVYRDCGKYIFTGDENMYIEETIAANNIKFVITTEGTDIKPAGKVICNKFIQGNDTIANSVRLGNSNKVIINIQSSTLESPDVSGFKAWLKANPTTIVYQLATPTVEIVENCVDIDLDTFQEKTYFSIENNIKGSLDFKVPSNIASIVQNTAREVNNIWDVINNLLVPSLIGINKNVAMATIKNNLK